MRFLSGTMRAAILILAISFPSVASAQDTALAPRDEAPAVASVQAPGSPRPLTPRKRRGSMVGYITDATIESQVRLRFDAGFHNNIPDRSEFFYAQCGCNSAGAP